MHIPYSYSLRNLWTRKLTTVLTVTGMALVVFVFSTVLMLAEGLKVTLVQTGSYDNAVVIRRSSQTEVQSGVERPSAAIIESRPEVAFGADGGRLASKELVVLVAMPKRDSDSPVNVIVRGVSQTGLKLRPQVTLKKGRLFRPGSSEIIVGHSISERFNGTQIGGSVRFGLREWAVVGTFDAGNSGFDSEIWGDAEQLMQAFRRPVYSSVIVKLKSPESLAGFKQAVESDPRLTVEAKRESVFYAEQSEMLARFISILGIVLSVIFAIGATIGAMITMYTSVANRTTEIGTLRALGFRRQNILRAFLAESLLLGIIGGIIGLGFASLMQWVSISTMNWQTFAELAFSFKLNGGIIVKSLLFALIMGFAGGFLPAARAARMNIIEALRAA
jgi:ABC-type antimicrobial peptide transport system permease subunit